MLPKDDKRRKSLPVFDGVIAYFPDAILEIAKVSLIGNAQHNPSEPLYWARGKSMDQRNTILRHMMDAYCFEQEVNEAPPEVLAALGFDEGPLHLANAAWRALAALQLACEDRAKRRKFLDSREPQVLSGCAVRAAIQLREADTHRGRPPAPTDAHESLTVARPERTADLHGSHPEFERRTPHHQV